MEPRLVLAYSLIALLALSIAAVVGYGWYHSRQRRDARRWRRENAVYERQAQERGNKPPE